MYLYDNGYKTVFGILIECEDDEIINIRLKDLCYSKLYNHHRISKDKLNEYLKRLDDELNIIFKKGMGKYFLESYKLISDLKNKSYIIGPDTSFASNSLINYLLEITEIDPLEYNLLFECFYNDELGICPKITLSIQESKGFEIYEYLKRKYSAPFLSDYNEMQFCSLCFFESLESKLDSMLFESIKIPNNDCELTMLQDMISASVGDNKRYIEQFKDFTFNDAISCISLYRPNAIYKIEDYLKLKQDNNECYPIAFKEVLKDTFGIVIYHEQIIQMISLISNNNYCISDIIRRCLLDESSKDFNDTFLKLKNDAIYNGYSESDAIKLCDFIKNNIQTFSKSYAISCCLRNYKEYICKILGNR